MSNENMISIAIQLSQDIMEDIKRISEDIKFDHTTILPNVEPEKFSKVDFIICDMSSMFADCLTEVVCEQPGHWMEMQNAYHNDLVEMFKGVKNNSTMDDYENASRKADEYLGVAQKFCQSILDSGQMAPLAAKFDSMPEKRHITIMPETRPVFSEEGAFIVNYSMSHLM